MVPGPESISAGNFKDLRQGLRCYFDGPLFFACKGRKIYRVLLSGSWGVSVLSLPSVSEDEARGQSVPIDNKIDLGKVGHVNQWMPLPLSLPVLNSAQVPLHVTARVLSSNWKPSSSLSDAPQRVVSGQGVDVHEDYRPHSIRFCAPGHSSLVDAEGDASGDGSGQPAGGEEVEYVVGPGMEEKLAAVFEVETVTNSGVCDAVVVLTNIHDPRNVVEYHITARVFAGTLLRFSGKAIDAGAAAADMEAGRGLSPSYTLVMPQLKLPVAPDDKCSETFTVTNTSHEVLELRATAEPEPSLAHVISVDILSSSSSTHVNSFSLDEQQTMQIMLVCKANQQAYVVPEELRGRSDVLLAKVSFDSQQFPKEELLVLGSFGQEPTLTLAPKKMALTFPSDLTLVQHTTPQRTVSSYGGLPKHLSPHAQTASFNLSSKCATPVPFEITLRLPPGVEEKRVCVDPTQGSLEAMSSMDIKLFVDVPLDKHGRFLTCEGPSSVVLVLRDTRLASMASDVASAGTCEVIVNLFQESCDTATPKLRALDTYHLPTLSLRGYCNLTNAILQTHNQRAPSLADGEDDLDAGNDTSSTDQERPQVGSLFEMDAGKLNQHAHDVSSTTPGCVTWNLVIEYMGKGPPQPFVVHTAKDEEWLRIKHGDEKGTLNTKGENKTLVVSLSTERIGVFSSYIYIDNLANPFDRKYIRVSMEVVMEHTSALQLPGDKDTEWFSVLIPEWFSSLDVHLQDEERGEAARTSAFSGSVHKQSDVVGMQRTRLVNLGQVMEGYLYRNRSFTIRNDSSVSLDFSVSTAVRESAVPRDKNLQQSELLLSSSYYVLKLVRTLTLPPQTSKRVFIFYRPAFGASQDAAEGLRETLEVTVRCKLVKDHQKVIRLVASCFQPRIGFPRKDTHLLFSRPTAALDAPRELASQAPVIQKSGLLQ